MSKLPAEPRSNLSRAGWLLFFEAAGLVVVALALIEAGITTDYLIVLVWLFNLVPAWFIAKAARDQGKRPLLYGIASAILPALAFAAWSKLQSARLWQTLEQKYDP